ncbi:DUF1559 domain-containing protein [Blastopirellula retiformator]|uniref:Uncharacterized protein n=1 Tax=Blastopirellula retiformator TaxID=2527970 RepID=A0A5C5UYS5_9BACT|nr:DUF1559 domain-containing protein [Blastopirellula retiformator]TWT30632.1 hypothetical protein Enr8_41530 [Blastopirellula retiformator]
MIFSTGCDGEYWVAGSVNYGLARSAKEGVDLSVNSSPALGSWQPGTCNFLFADGSVQGITVSVNPSVLVSLGGALEGDVVSLPYCERFSAYQRSPFWRRFSGVVANRCIPFKGRSIFLMGLP